LAERTERTVSALTAACAVIAVAITLARSGGQDPASLPERKSTFVSDWQTLRKNALVLGDTTARIWIVEFTDFQCPFCKVFHETLLSVRRRFPSEVAVAIVHFPLPSHRHARSAAVAVECASRQGQADHMIDKLYLLQDSLGRQPLTWTSPGLMDT
jgi:protein-disulfide isomerase